jgi:hypothetical protein
VDLPIIPLFLGEFPLGEIMLNGVVILSYTLLVLESYFSGTSYGQGSSIPLGSMSTLRGNPFGGMYGPGSSNVSGSPFIPRGNPPRGMYSPKSSHTPGSASIPGEITLLEL